MYSITNSKELVTTNKKWGGCGSSRTVSSLICEPVRPLDCPKEDQFITIDNNQKVGIHPARVKEGSKVPLSYVLPCVTLLPNQKHFYNMIIPLILAIGEVNIQN